MRKISSREQSVGQVVSLLQTTDMATCSSCESNYFKIIATFYGDNSRALDYLISHGVISSGSSRIPCPKCGTFLSFREQDHLFICRSTFTIPKTKKRRNCGFSASQFKGSFLSNCHFAPWKLVLLVNHYLSRHWDYKTIQDCLGLSPNTVCDWRSFCSEVTEQWFSNQDPIRGVGVEVEVDETLIVRRKYERGRVLNQVWLFGGIEPASKRHFVVPLNSEYGSRRDAETLIPIIQKFVRPGSIIYSDSWPAYRKLSELGYGHHAFNHKKHFVKPGEPEVNTQRVERLWRDIKEWVKRPGICSRYL
ncbi:hypothetical protein ElyMa_003553900 [Elysia marginata]|uniref:ISXO2-like transposase domain-containing protein n=1 Tax=Elysia marginata TaxID=1093978 RepID=A0AAV4EL11_9GAST|nr:hypothetical protein ElyMa_003553900 [Elysia marginata]